MKLPVDYPEFSGTEFSSTLSEASLITNYDTRNNVFSPSKGFYITCSGTYSDEWFGGDGLYGRLAIEALGWFPASKRVNIGLRYANNYSLGDIPFYARPISTNAGSTVNEISKQKYYAYGD